MTTWTQVGDRHPGITKEEFTLQASTGKVTQTPTSDWEREDAHKTSEAVPAEHGSRVTSHTSRVGKRLIAAAADIREVTFMSGWVQNPPN